MLFLSFNRIGFEGRPFLHRTSAPRSPRQAEAFSRRAGQSPSFPWKKGGQKTAPIASESFQKPQCKNPASPLPPDTPSNSLSLTTNPTCVFLQCHEARAKFEGRIPSWNCWCMNEKAHRCGQSRGVDTAQQYTRKVLYSYTVYTKIPLYIYRPHLPKAAYTYLQLRALTYN